jgi:ArsR family transcriptional regulator
MGATATTRLDKRLEQLRALADPTRLKILELLKKPGCCSISVDDRKGGMCVCDLTGPLGLTQPTITHHLKVLRRRGWWSAGRSGRGFTAGATRRRCKRWVQRSPVVKKICSAI